MIKTLIILIVITLNLLAFSNSEAQIRGTENLSRFDDRPLHFGFYLGMNTMGYRFTHYDNVYLNPVFTDNALLQSDAEGIYKGIKSYRVEMRPFKPGFTVGGVLNLRMTNVLDFRFTPGMSLGVRQLIFSNGVDEIIKNSKLNMDNDPLKYKTTPSAYIDFPVGIRYKGFRAQNVRPYIYLGGAYRRDLENKRITESVVHLGRDGVYGEIALGLDSYLPFFRFTSEFKFSYGLNNIIRHNIDVNDPANIPYFGFIIKELNSNIFSLLIFFE